MTQYAKSTQPRFSILTPVYNPPRDAFELCVESVFAQTFSDWEWCLVDDQSTQPWVRTRLAQLHAHDKRVHVYSRPINDGIVSASNDAIALATGEFVALLDHDDELHPSALKRVDERLKTDSTIDYLYTNEDKIDDKGVHYDVFRKPKWSPERFLAQNYCSHLSVIRLSTLNEAGRFRKGFDGSQDYDLFLRITERARKIEHLPEVLYHWRAVKGSTARAHDEKPYAFIAAMKAVKSALVRRGIRAIVGPTDPYPFQKVLRVLNEYPLVSIIIPTCGTRRSIFGNDTCLVVNAVESVVRKTNYPNYEIIVVIDTHTPEYVSSELRRACPNRLKLIDYDKSFNFADKSNIGVVNSSGELVLLLNDDTEIIDKNWLTVMVGYFQESDVAMVGPLLILEDGRIQSAAHSNTPIPHNFRTGESVNQPGEFGILAVARECSGVTGACALIRRSHFIEVGGLSNVYPKAFNDVDFAFKLLEVGYRIIWTPYVRLFHFETASRAKTVDAEEVENIYNRWQRKFDHDEYCSLL